MDPRNVCENSLDALRFGHHIRWFWQLRTFSSVSSICLLISFIMMYFLFCLAHTLIALASLSLNNFFLSLCSSVSTQRVLTSIHNRHHTSLRSFFFSFHWKKGRGHAIYFPSRPFYRLHLREHSTIVTFPFTCSSYSTEFAHVSILHLLPELISMRLFALFNLLLFVNF